MTTEKRNSLAPKVATISELGYPQVQIDLWQGIPAPAKTPPAIIKKSRVR